MRHAGIRALSGIAGAGQSGEHLHIGALGTPRPAEETEPSPG